MIELTLTKDNSPTLFSARFNQTYHSKYGAIAESNHVFIKNGIHRIAEIKSELTVFEMGFGTGLNAYLTILEAAKLNIKIHYYTLEKYPLSNEIYEAFKMELKNAPLNHDFKLFEALHHAPWNESTTISPFFNIQKKALDVHEYHFPSSKFDLVYYDAFSPDVQPELWDTMLFQKIYDAMTSNSLLTTYCAKGQVKRNLKSCGFEVQSPPGPIGKREMTIGVKK